MRWPPSVAIVVPRSPVPPFRRDLAQAGGQDAHPTGQSPFIGARHPLPQLRRHPHPRVGLASRRGRPDRDAPPGPPVTALQQLLADVRRITRPRTSKETDMPVSAATEAKLRAAMQRLLDGTPQR